MELIIFAKEYLKEFFMEDPVRQISSIDLKVRKLIDLYTETRNVLAESQNEMQILKGINEEQLQTINNLKEKTTLLKIAKIAETKEGSTDAKLKINELVREIDKCIGLLKA